MQIKERRDITCISLSAREMEGGFASREGWSSAISNGRAERSVERMEVRWDVGGSSGAHVHITVSMTLAVFVGFVRRGSMAEWEGGNGG